ncbi:MAG: 3-deoxy-D-manno-octulosonic acid transferase, partial [Amylibacter sp.]|nr:3-deoxy-D-manno-octulosonic acid transferase [Amylibacter sp.]
MQSFSIGLAANYILAWVLQPFVKSRLSNSIEKGELHKKLADQLQGFSLQTRGEKTLIWLHAKTLATAASFGEIVAHFEENNNI